MSKSKVNLTIRIDEDIYKKFASANFNFSQFMQHSLYSLLKTKKIYLNLITGEVLYDIQKEDKNRGEK